MQKQVHEQQQDEASPSLISVHVHSMCSTNSDYIREASEVIRILQGKWKLQILCAMRGDAVRLSQLMRLLPAASKKSLRASLRDLEAAQIVVRRDLSDTVLHVEYEFADHLKEVIGSLLDQLARWGELIEVQKKSLS